MRSDHFLHLSFIRINLGRFHHCGRRRGRMVCITVVRHCVVGRIAPRRGRHLVVRLGMLVRGLKMVGDALELGIFVIGVHLGLLLTPKSGRELVMPSDVL